MKLISVLILYRSVCNIVSREEKKKKKLEKKKEEKREKKKIKDDIDAYAPPPLPVLFTIYLKTLHDHVKPRKTTHRLRGRSSSFRLLCTFQRPDLSLEGAMPSMPCRSLR